MIDRREFLKLAAATTVMAAIPETGVCGLYFCTKACRLADLRNHNPY